MAGQYLIQKDSESIRLQIGGQHLLLLQHGVEVGEEAVHVLGPHVRVRAANI